MKKIKKNRFLLRKLHQDNQGAAMAMVLVIILFISIIAAVLMFLSYLGLQMRLIDRQGKDTFYTAETVLDEINAGLQQEVSSAMAKAYNDVMTQYSFLDTPLKRSNKFNEIYVDELKTALQGVSAEGTYDISILRSYLSEEILGDIDAADLSDPAKRGSRASFNTYGAIVESNLSDDSYRMVKRDSESLLLQDLKVTYVSPGGYVSIISTDIRLVLPTISFAQASELPNLYNTSLIADETLAMGNVNAGSGVTIQGDAYAGRMAVGKTDEHNFLSRSQVFFENLESADESDYSMVVSREDVVVNDSEISTDSVDFWAQNVLLSDSNAVMKGSTNLKDDILLQGLGSKLRLSGEYTGFGMMATAPSTTIVEGEDGEEVEEDNSTNPAYSSAIVVNGRESVLDLSGLESLTIAGRAYVKTKVEYEGNEEGIDPDQVNKSNIMMGESIALKSNQLVYLVPGEALGCIIKEDGSIGDSMYGSNPLTLDQYQEISDFEKYVLLDGDKQISALGFKPLSNYIEKENVAGRTESIYVPELIFKQTSAGTLVYCYLRFPNEEKANMYFQDYYNVNAEQVSRYTKLYANEIRMADPTAMTYLNLAGNMLVYTPDQVQATMIAAPDDGQGTYYTKNRQAKDISVSKNGIFSALSAKMVTDTNQLTMTEMGQTAFQNIIDRGKLEEILNAASSHKVEIETGEAGNIKTAILTDTDYAVEGSTPDTGIIVSLGNVEVKKDFNGLILAAGDITISAGGGGVKLAPMDLGDFTEIFDASRDIGGTEYYVLDVFRDGKNFSAGGAAGGGDSVKSRLVPVDLIVYERWNKR